MYDQRPIRDAVRYLVDQHAAFRRVEWAKMKGKRANMEPPSAAFVNDVEVTYLGPSSLDLMKAKAISEFTFEWNPPSKVIVDKIERLFKENNVDFASRARSGAPYWAGPYANKQISNWTKPGQQDALVRHAFSIYRAEWWQEEGKPRLLQTLWDESQRALDALTYMQGSAEDYLLAGKSPETGVGYNKLYRNRLALARAIDRGDAQHVLEHDIELFRDGQQEIWDKWPFYGTIVRGYLGYTGSSAVSRSDVDVTSVRKDGNKYTWTVEAAVRGANITPISFASTKAIVPRQKMAEILAAHCPFGYMRPMTREVMDVFLYPPVTATFADQCDYVTLDADWGFCWPPPRVEVHGSSWTYVLPKEEFKSGADGFIGLGSGNQGATGWITPEWSSGRPATRVGYEDFVDNNVSHYLSQAGIRFRAASNGDDQAIQVRYDDVPAVYDTILPPYLRTKGSQGNVVFRWGKECVFTSPDHVAVFNIPRPVKTMTSANLAMKAGPVDMNIEMGQTRMLEVQYDAAKAAARTWEVAPEVFFIEGDPKEIVRTFKSSAYQECIHDAILAGAVDQHVATYMGDVDLEEEI